MRRAFFLLALAFHSAGAQTPLPADAPVHASPGGVRIATLKRGAVVRAGRTSGTWTSVLLQGWVISSRIGPRRDTLDRVVTGRGSAQLRIADGADQLVVAELEQGAAIKRVSERRGWTQVRRSVWVPTSSLARRATPPASRGTAAAPPPVRDPVAQRSAATPPAGQSRGDTTAGISQQTTRTTTMRSAPGGEERASIRAGTAMETLSRADGWARVRIEGWVPEKDLGIGDSSSAEVSAADLRADPAAHRGRIVKWEVQAISVQKADPLRRSMNPDEPYLLALGPGEERAVLYVALTKALEDQVRALPQLTTILITARVRDGRSAPVGAPLLYLFSFTRVQ
jgi:hypothetical protein